ncbi:hypothetical protein IMZ48_26445, partial [Candidatus Bathyarchaeota archaeon]|nr:hypothetical protein [Candidatus Bathyarchaeota archaeon]
FNRAWIIQEVVLAKHLTILCGDYQLEWEVLARCSRYIVSCIAPSDLMIYLPDFLSREQTQSGRMVKRPGYDISGLDTLKSQSLREEIDIGILIGYVYMGRIKDATDPRDRFFAMLGLLKKHPAIRNSESLRARIPTIDYSKSVAEVFVDSAILVIELSDKTPLVILSMVEDRSRRSPELMDELPSWVADLKVPLSPDPMLRLSPTGRGVKSSEAKLWDPCMDYNDNVANPVPIDGRFLCITGAMFDTITQVSLPLELNFRFSWTQVLETFRPHWSSVISGTAFMDALWRTMVANLETPGANTPADASFGWGFVERLLRRAVGGRALHDSQGLIDVLTQASFASGAATPIAPDKIQQCLAIMRGPRSPQTAAIDARIDAYEKIMTSVCGTRRLFLTSGNYMGVGAQSAEVGDQVWIFPGANVPFVLRPGAAGRFRLVGEAYVHGIMYGEIAPSLVERYQDIELE